MFDETDFLLKFYILTYGYDHVNKIITAQGYYSLVIKTALWALLVLSKIIGENYSNSLWLYPPTKIQILWGRVELDPLSPLWLMSQWIFVNYIPFFYDKETFWEGHLCAIPTTPTPSSSGMSSTTQLYTYKKTKKLAKDP